MNNLDEYGFNKNWIAPDVQADVYRQMLKKKKLRADDDIYVLSHVVADKDFCMRLVDAMTRFITSEQRLLSIAEGDGQLIAEFKKRGFKKLVGVDICPELVAIGQSKGLDLRVADARHLPFIDAEFDGVIINEAIGALGLSEALLEARRVLNPKGQIIITNYNYAEHNAEHVESDIVKYRYVQTDLIRQALCDKNFTNVSQVSIPIYSSEEEQNNDQMDILFAVKGDVVE